MVMRLVPPSSTCPPLDRCADHPPVYEGARSPSGVKAKGQQHDPGNSFRSSTPEEESYYIHAGRSATHSGGIVTSG